MINPTDPARAEKLLIDAQAVAKQFGLKLNVLRASSEPEIEAAFSSFSQFRGAALVIGSDTLYTSETRLLAELSLRYAVPTIYEYIEFVRAGGLMGYGGNKESYRWAGIYAGRILKGEKPADLPVQQSTTVELSYGAANSSRPRRRGDRIELVCCSCSRLLLDPKQTSALQGV
jgi:putative ABC transport system substrate-binding protein